MEPIFGIRSQTIVYIFIFPNLKLHHPSSLFIHSLRSSFQFFISFPPNFTTHHHCFVFYVISIYSFFFSHGVWSKFRSHRSASIECGSHNGGGASHFSGQRHHPSYSWFRFWLFLPDCRLIRWRHVSNVVRSPHCESSFYLWEPRCCWERFEFGELGWG